PYWRWQAAAGIAFAAFVFGTAFAVCRRKRQMLEPMLGRWVGVAATGLAGGALIGWVVANVPIESLGIDGWARSLVLAGLAVASPIAGAAALMSGTALPSFAQAIGPAAVRVPDPLKVLLGAVMILLCVFAIQSALGLVFDPRYRDFPFAPMTATLVPLLALSFASPRRAGRRGPAETTVAALLAGCVLYIVPDESFANWQALWLCAVLLGFALTLWRLRGAQKAKKEQGGGQSRRADIVEHDPKRGRDHRDGEEQERWPDQVEHRHAEGGGAEHPIFEQGDRRVARDADPGGRAVLA